MGDQLSLDLMESAFSPALVAVLVFATLITGCIPLGSRLGREEIVAGRFNADGHTGEQVIGVPTEHHWMMLVAPDGPELNTILSETWRFYLVGTNGQHKALRFLRRRGGNVMPWCLIASVSHTNLWIAVIGTGSQKRVEHGHFDYRVICFTESGITSEETLDYPEYGEFNFDSENHTLTYRMEGHSRSYDPLGNTHVR